MSMWLKSVTSDLSIALPSLSQRNKRVMQSGNRDDYRGVFCASSQAVSSLGYKDTRCQTPMSSPASMKKSSIYVVLMQDKPWPRKGEKKNI